MTTRLRGANDDKGVQPLTEVINVGSFQPHKDWRLAYGYFATSVSRQLVPVGTTNQELILHDATGNRRCLPVRTRGIDIEALKRDREQLLAGAIELAKTYGPLVMPAGLTAEVLRRLEELTVVDYGLERLNDYISDKLSVNPHYIFRKDELFGVTGVTKPKSKHGKVLTHVARQFGLRETKRTINGRGFASSSVRKRVRERTA